MTYSDAAGEADRHPMRHQTLFMPLELVELSKDIARHLSGSGVGPVSKAAVMRAAMQRGLRRLAEEYRVPERIIAGRLGDQP